MDQRTRPHSRLTIKAPCPDCQFTIVDPVKQVVRHIKRLAEWTKPTDQCPKCGGLGEVLREKMPEGNLSPPDYSVRFDPCPDCTTTGGNMSDKDPIPIIILEPSAIDLNDEDVCEKCGATKGKPCPDCHPMKCRNCGTLFVMGEFAWEQQCDCHWPENIRGPAKPTGGVDVEALCQRVQKQRGADQFEARELRRTILDGIRRLAADLEEARKLNDSYRKQEVKEEFLLDEYRDRAEKAAAELELAKRGWQHEADRAIELAVERNEMREEIKRLKHEQ